MFQAMWRPWLPEYSPGEWFQKRWRLVHRRSEAKRHCSVNSPTTSDRTKNCYWLHRPLCKYGERHARTWTWGRIVTDIRSRAVYRGHLYHPGTVSGALRTRAGLGHAIDTDRSKRWIRDKIA